jgi:hypothetical protein
MPILVKHALHQRIGAGIVDEDQAAIARGMPQHRRDAIIELGRRIVDRNDDRRLHVILEMASGAGGGSRRATGMSYAGPAFARLLGFAGKDIKPLARRLL